MVLVDYFTIILASLNILGMIFIVYKFFRDPDIKNEGDIRSLSQACKYKHDAINNKFANISDNYTKDIKRIKKDIHYLRKNHIDHMEDDLRDLVKTQTRILAILEEKYQIKLD